MGLSERRDIRTKFKAQNSVRAMKAGAIDFPTKPVEDEVLLDAIRVALARSLNLEVLYSEGPNAR